MNPCSCWSLHDGALTVAIWSIVFSLLFLALLGWQTSVVKFCIDNSRWNLQNTFIGQCGSMPNECPCIPGQNMERFDSLLSTAFALQLCVIVLMAFMLFASITLVFGIIMRQKYMYWPFFPITILANFMLMGYCITWWAGGVSHPSYLGPSILAVICIAFNVYCFIVILGNYKELSANSQKPPRRGPPYVLPPKREYPEMYTNNSTPERVIVYTRKGDPAKERLLSGSARYDRPPFDTELPPKYDIDRNGSTPTKTNGFSGGTPPKTNPVLPIEDSGYPSSPSTADRNVIDSSDKSPLIDYAVEPRGGTPSQNSTLDTPSDRNAPQRLETTFPAAGSEFGNGADADLDHFILQPKHAPSAYTLPLRVKMPEEDQRQTRAPPASAGMPVRLATRRAPLSSPDPQTPQQEDTPEQPVTVHKTRTVDYRSRRVDDYSPLRRANSDDNLADGEIIRQRAAYASSSARYSKRKGEARSHSMSRYLSETEVRTSRSSHHKRYDSKHKKSEHYDGYKDRCANGHNHHHRSSSHSKERHGKSLIPAPPRQVTAPSGPQPAPFEPSISIPQHIVLPMSSGPQNVQINSEISIGYRKQEFKANVV